jgi:hypothetical protein
LLHRSDSVDDAFDYITTHLAGDVSEPGGQPTEESGVLTAPAEKAAATGQRRAATRKAGPTEAGPA